MKVTLGYVLIYPWSEEMLITTIQGGQVHFGPSGLRGTPAFRPPLTLNVKYE